MVTLTAIQSQIMADCQSFVDVADSFSEELFSQQSGNKWAVADVAQHLYLSARPLARLLTGPRDILLQWGKADAPPKTYDDVVAAYQQRLSDGVKSPAAFSPQTEDMQVNKKAVLTRFEDIYQTLADSLTNWSEQELDEYTIPHPALGKLSVREMLIFVSIHTRHHLMLLPNK